MTHKQHLPTLPVPRHQPRLPKPIRDKQPNHAVDNLHRYGRQQYVLRDGDGEHGPLRQRVLFIRRQRADIELDRAVVDVVRLTRGSIRQNDGRREEGMGEVRVWPVVEVDYEAGEDRQHLEGEPFRALSTTHS